jgi:hypothetical protein
MSCDCVYDSNTLKIKHNYFDEMSPVLNETLKPFTEFRRALLVGTVRNASKFVGPDITRILNSFNALIPTVAFIVESDSEDDTIRELEELCSSDERVRFVCLGELRTSIPDRLDRLKYCRNIYVEEIRNNVEYSDCDLIVVADLDGINTAISEKEVRIVAATSVEWDVLAANQSGPYYDILALRHPLWSPNNFILEMEWLTPFLGRRRAWQHALGDRMIRIDPSLAPMPVDSAFGGLCIYKRWIFEKFDYTEDIPEAATETDHVTLNRKAKTAGAQVYIHPGLINTRWTTHSLDTVGWIRWIKFLVHLYPFRIFLPILRKITVSVGTRK